MDTPFSQKTLDFLFENKMQDSRSWFWEHKKEYQTLVIEPLRQLVMDLSPAMLELDPESAAFGGTPVIRKTPPFTGITCGSSSNGAGGCTARIIRDSILR